MERPRRFEDGVIPDAIKKQDEGVMAAKREHITEDTARIIELQQRYDTESGDPENGGDRSELRDQILELRTKIVAREEEIRRYEEDPNSDFLVHKIEREEIKKRIMEEMGYSERLLGLLDQYIESLRKRGVE